MKKTSLLYISFMAFMMFQSCSDTGLRQGQDMLEAEKLASARTVDENVVEADASHQEEANQKITKLNEWFGKTENRSGEETINYPHYYGGSFITYTTAAGDSGGLIYSYISSTGTRRTVGVHKGRILNGNAIYSKA